jgi:hypothetical protein
MTSVKAFFAIAIFEEGRDDAIELPRRGGTGWIEVLPTNIDLESGLLIMRQILLVVR